MTDYRAEITATQRGMKTCDLVRFMNRFEPFAHNVHFGGSNKGLCIDWLVAWIETGDRTGRHAVPDESAEARFKQANTALRAFREEYDAVRAVQERDKAARDEMFRKAEVEAKTRIETTKRKVLMHLAGTPLEPLVEGIHYGAHACGVPHDMLIQLVQGYRKSGE